MECTCLLHKGCCPIHGEKWEREFEDIFGYIMEDGMTLENINNWYYLIEKYLHISLADDTLTKVKIKVRDGCIQIERNK